MYNQFVTTRFGKRFIFIDGFFFSTENHHTSSGDEEISASPQTPPSTSSKEFSSAELQRLSSSSAISRTGTKPDKKEKGLAISKSASEENFSSKRPLSSSSRVVSARRDNDISQQTWNFDVPKRASETSLPVGSPVLKSKTHEKESRSDKKGKGPAHSSSKKKPRSGAQNHKSSLQQTFKNFFDECRKHNINIFITGVTEANYNNVLALGISNYRDIVHITFENTETAVNNLVEHGPLFTKIDDGDELCIRHYETIFMSHNFHLLLDMQQRLTCIDLSPTDYDTKLKVSLGLCQTQESPTKNREIRRKSSKTDFSPTEMSNNLFMISGDTSPNLPPLIMTDEPGPSSPLSTMNDVLGSSSTQIQTSAPTVSICKLLPRLHTNNNALDKRDVPPPESLAQNKFDYCKFQLGGNKKELDRANEISSYILADIRNSTRINFTLFDILKLCIAVLPPLLAFIWFGQRTVEIAFGVNNKNDCDKNNNDDGNLEPIIGIYLPLFWTLFCIVQIPTYLFSTLNMQRNINGFTGFITNWLYDKDSKLANENHSFTRHFIGTCFTLYVSVFSAMATALSCYRILFETKSPQTPYLHPVFLWFCVASTAASAVNTNFAFTKNTVNLYTRDNVSLTSDGFGYTDRLVLKNILERFPNALNKASRENPEAAIVLIQELRKVNQNRDLCDYEKVCVHFMLIKEFMSAHKHISDIAGFTKKNIGNYITLKNAFFGIFAFLAALPSYKQSDTASIEIDNGIYHGKSHESTTYEDIKQIFFISIVTAAFLANVLINYDSLHKLNNFFWDSLRTHFRKASLRMKEIHEYANTLYFGEKSEVIEADESVDASEDAEADKTLDVSIDIETGDGISVNIKTGKKDAPSPYEVLKQLNTKSLLVNCIENVSREFAALHFHNAIKNLIWGLIPTLENLIRTLPYFFWRTLSATSTLLVHLLKQSGPLLKEGASDLNASWKSSGWVEIMEALCQVVLSIAAASASGSIAYTFPVFCLLRVIQATFNCIITMAISNRALNDFFNKLNYLIFSRVYQLTLQEDGYGPKKAFKNAESEPVRKKRVAACSAMEIEKEAAVLLAHVSDMPLKNLALFYPDSRLNHGYPLLRQQYHKSLLKIAGAAAKTGGNETQELTVSQELESGSSSDSDYENTLKLL